MSACLFDIEKINESNIRHFQMKDKLKFSWTDASEAPSWLASLDFCIVRLVKKLNDVSVNEILGQ